MRQFVIVLNILLLCLTGTNKLHSQSLPVGTAVLEDYYRNKQLLGAMDSSISFTVRPIFPSSKSGMVNPESILTDDFWTRNIDTVSQILKTSFAILPVSWKQQYNSAVPYGWNDGGMIPSKGFQTMFSAGVFASIGPLSVQLRPEYVYAQNAVFQTIDIYGGRPDLPTRFGKSAFSEVTWGQSSIRLNWKAISLGMSNENLTWGPGIRNSLLMSNNARGFKHITLNSLRPIHTSAGSLEFQVIAGRLEGSGFSTLENDPKYSDWRYLSAAVISFQPKWVPGLFLGLTRGFQAYSKDIKKLGDYIPFFIPYQKANRDVLEEPFGRDQLTSVFARWLFVKAHAEVYFEFGANDNAYNFRDFIGSPEHSRAYTFGFSKITSLRGMNADEFIKINAEVTQMSQTADRLVRGAGYWYQHGEVLHGYTHKGEVLGSGIGPGGNLQSLSLSWLRGVKSLGLQFERYIHNDDYYNAVIGDLNGRSRRWVDLTVATQGAWNYKNFIFNSQLQLTRSVNYQWQQVNLIPTTPAYKGVNFHGKLGFSYFF